MTRDDIVESIIEQQTAQIEASTDQLMRVATNLRMIAGASLAEIDEILARASIIEDLGTKVVTTVELAKLRDTLKFIMNNVSEPVGTAHAKVSTESGNLDIDVTWDSE